MMNSDELRSLTLSPFRPVSESPNPSEKTLYELDKELNETLNQYKSCPSKVLRVRAEVSAQQIIDLRKKKTQHEFSIQGNYSPLLSATRLTGVNEGVTLH